MFAERRKHQRFAINRVARIQAEHGSFSRECTITDISESGARLFVTDADLPDQFSLVISGEKQVREECRVVWRLGGEMGVTFITHTVNQARDATIKRLTTEAQRVFGQVR
jgi:hypothetical protein